MEAWRDSGHRHYLRGPNGAIGNSSTSKQVSKFFGIPGGPLLFQKTIILHKKSRRKQIPYLQVFVRRYHALHTVRKLMCVRVPGTCKGLSTHEILKYKCPGKTFLRYRILLFLVIVFKTIPRYKLNLSLPAALQIRSRIYFFSY
jgi:hypothetical protein